MPDSNDNKILPETDGWDKEASSHPKIMFLRYLFFTVTILIVSSIGYLSYLYINKLRKDRRIEYIDALDISITDNGFKKISWRYRGIKTLEIENGSNISNFKPIQYFTHLEKISFSNCPRLINLAPLKYLHQLHVIYLRRCDNLNSINAIKNLDNIYHLQISGCPKLLNLEPISGLSRLLELQIWDTNIDDLSPIRNNKKLTHILLISCPNISDISALYNLKNLKEIIIWQCENITSEQIAQLKIQLPNCYVEYKEYSRK